jgi:hypothetical protein
MTYCSKVRPIPHRTLVTGFRFRVSVSVLLECDIEYGKRVIAATDITIAHIKHD